MKTQDGQSSTCKVETEEHIQTNLWGELEEKQSYLSKQLITYIGNKRALLGAIDVAITKVKKRLGKRHIRLLDAFAGSGVVSRNFKRHASYLASIDLEDYAAVIADCFLRNKSTLDHQMLKEIVCDFNGRVDKEEMPVGFIQELYAPKSDEKITKEDRVFYSTRNARRLDNYRRMIPTC